MKSCGGVLIGLTSEIDQGSTPDAFFRARVPAAAIGVAAGAIPSPRFHRQGEPGMAAYDRLIASKSLVHIHDLAEHELYHGGEPLVVASVKGGIGTFLFVPLLRNDELTRLPVPSL